MFAASKRVNFHIYYNFRHCKEIPYLGEFFPLKDTPKSNYLRTFMQPGPGPFFRNMQHNSLFKFLFCPDLTIAMLSWQVFQPVPSNLYNSSKMLLQD